MKKSIAPGSGVQSQWAWLLEICPDIKRHFKTPQVITTRNVTIQDVQTMVNYSSEKKKIQLFSGKGKLLGEVGHTSRLPSSEIPLLGWLTVRIPFFQLDMFRTDPEPGDDFIETVGLALQRLDPGDQTKYIVIASNPDENGHYRELTVVGCPEKPDLGLQGYLIQRLGMVREDVEVNAADVAA